MPLKRTPLKRTPPQGAASANPGKPLVDRTADLPQQLQRWWTRLRRLPGGKLLFSRRIGRQVPYTGSMRAHVVRFEQGSAVVELPDRRAVRNHLRSIHAIALANLAELTANLALLSILPAGSRFIVVHLAIDYRKKARGTIIARCRCELPERLRATHEQELIATLIDGEGDEVARAIVRSRIETPA